MAVCEIEMRTRSVSAISEFVSSEVSTESNRQNDEQKRVDRLCRMIKDVQRLMIAWNECIDDLSDDLASGEPIDYLTVGRALKHASDTASEALSGVDRMVKTFRSKGYKEIPSVDLELRELANIVRWVRGWPSLSDDEIEARRRVIETEAPVSDDELASPITPTE